MKFSEDTKQVKDAPNGNWFGFGVHKVNIGMIELSPADAEKEYIEITVVGDDEEEDTARVWFTSEKAANYSFNVLRGIYVHNAPEAAKDAARETMDAVQDTTEFVAKLNEKLIGGECWFTKYLDPTRTYIAADGTTKQSVNKNIYGYEPKLRPALLPKEAPTSGNTTVDAAFPGAQKASNDIAAGIPNTW